jgi:threonine/homoserine/homoserine lactone efflux protein
MSLFPISKASPLDKGMTILVSGLGLATADAVYGSIAGFGLTLISDFLISQQVWLRLMGGLFLCALALKILGNSL